MKKQVLLLSITATLAACTQSGSNVNFHKTDLKLLSPTGAPAVALAGYANKLETASDPQSGLMPMFATNDYDIIVAPTHGGLNKIKAGANYLIAATVTLGNFYLLSTGRDEDEILNEGDKVMYFQPSDVPGKVFNYLYGDKGLELYAVDAANKTAPVINAGGVYKVDETTTVNLDYIFTAEPVVTSTNSVSKIYESGRDAFNIRSGGKQIMQASIFVNKNADHDKVDEFLANVENDMKSGLKSPNLLKNFVSKLGSKNEQAQKIGFTADVVYNATKNNNNGLGLGFRKAKDAKQDIEDFVNLLTNNTYGELSEEVIYQ